MKKSVLEWHDATTSLPTSDDYNKDGFVMVAYEDGSVANGFEFDGEWRFNELHGNAMFWAPYPVHPRKKGT